MELDFIEQSFTQLIAEMKEHQNKLKNFRNVELLDCLNILDMKFIDNQKTYYRGVKNNPITDEDFLSSYREHKRPYKKPKDRKEFCSYHGISVFIDKEKVKAAIKNIQRHYKPGHQGRGIKYILKFRFHEEAGLISHGHGAHKTFYKSDLFNIEKLEPLNIEKIDGEMP